MNSITPNLSGAWDPDFRKPHFPFAYFYNADKGWLPVYKPGDKFSGQGEAYDAERHGGRLFCPGKECWAELHYNPGKEEKGGNPQLRQKAHLKTNAESDHKYDCIYKPGPHEEKEYDDTIGYRVHLNLKKFIPPARLQDTFNQSASIYYKGEMGRPKLKAQFIYLEKRRSFEIHEPKNFLTLLGRGDFARLKDSVFINHDIILREKEFIIRHSRKAGELELRFINLYARLLELRDGGMLPCLMEFRLEKGMENKESNPNHSVISKMLFMSQEKSEKGYDGRRHYIAPRAMPGDGLEQEMREVFAKPGTYLILGYASPSETIEKDDAVIHYMDIQIMSMAQILKADLDTALAKALKKQKGLKKHYDEPKLT